MPNKCWQRGNELENRALFSLHTTSVPGTSLMVISAQMQKSVNQQHRKFFAQRTTSLNRLLHGCWNRDYDVAEQWCPGSFCFAHREGKHVRCAVFFSISAIEPAHAPVTDQFDTEIRF